MCLVMADRPKGIGRGGRGAALMQLLNQQQVRNPGEVQPSSSQQPAAGVGAVPQQPSGPAAGPPSEASAPRSSVQPAAAQPPQAGVAAAPVEPDQPAATRGRGAMLQRLYDTQMAQQQQQPASLSATPEASESGNSLVHCNGI